MTQSDSNKRNFAFFGSQKIPPWAYELEPGTPASRKSLPAGGPLGHGRLPAGAAHAAATAMATQSLSDQGATCHDLVRSNGFAAQVMKCCH